MTLTRALPLLAVVGAVTIAGCGSSDDSSSGSTSASTPPAPGQIGMKNIAFTPTSTTVKVGEKITWTNDEAVQHNVVADSGADFKSDLLAKGQTFSYTPTKAGLIKYECTIHSGMVATITVK